MRTARPARPIFESLESRRMLSVAPAVADDVAPPDPPPVECVSAEQLAADRAKVQQDMTQLHADQAAWRERIAADRAALHAAIDALQAQLAPLRQKLSEDQAKCAATILADRAAIHEASLAGQATIQADLAAVAAAGHDPVKRQAALDKLAADRLALQQTLAPLMQTLHDDAAACAAVLAADQKAIADAIHNDTAVTQAHDKLAADMRAGLAALAAGRHQLMADMQKLREDLAHRCTDGDGHHDGDTHTA